MQQSENASEWRIQTPTDGQNRPRGASDSTGGKMASHDHEAAVRACRPSQRVQRSAWPRVARQCRRGSGAREGGHVPGRSRETMGAGYAVKSIRAIF